MNFVDKVRVYVEAGRGGNGCLSFHREKYVPLGGPDGADGGKGGDIHLEASADLTTLLDLAYRPHIRGRDGTNGRGSNKTGTDGADTVVLVPIGTVVFRDGRLAADLSSPGQRFLVGRGGRGGRGNLSFKTRFNTAPRLYEKGAPGEKSVLDLELKLLADVGLLGLPNAGKSTLLARLTRARPKIADYPFTTLSPHLGVASHKGVHFVMADIPGLIEGAHRGRGLGHDFLRHIERTRVLIHLVDPAGFPPRSALEGIRVIDEELASHSKVLASKPRIMAVNKLDLPGGSETLRKIRGRWPRRRPLGISAATGLGLERLLDRVIEELSRHPAEGPLGPGPEVPVPRLEPGFRVQSLGRGRYELAGPFVERSAAMLDPGLPEAVERFQRMLKKIGVDRSLRAAGIKPGDLVRCGSLEFEWVDGDQERAPTRRRRP